MIAGGVNRGAQALNGWLAYNFVYREGRVACTLGVSIETIGRWRSGEATPGEDEREAIGRLTEGAVTGAMWDETVLPTVIGVDPGDPRGDVTGRFVVDEAGQVDSSPPLPFLPPALLCAISGPLGTVPSGPPFRATIDPTCPGQFVLAGPGMAIVLDETLGWSMRDALTAGLQDIRGAGTGAGATTGSLIG